MANSEQLDILRQGPAAWNRWREETKPTVIDLSEAYLSRANLSEANLCGANFVGANLVGANLSRANLKDANLSWADVNDANLREANLTEANLSEAYLSRANLVGANLVGAYLKDAYLKEANLTEANLDEANIENARLRGAVAPSGATRIRGVISGPNIRISGLEYGFTPEQVTKLLEAQLQPAERRLGEVATALGVAQGAMRAMLKSTGRADVSDLSDLELTQALAEYVASTVKANAEAAGNFNWAEPAKTHVQMGRLEHPVPYARPDEASARRLRAFLCHAKEDKPKVIDLYHRLREANVEPWLDVFNLIPGQKWEAEIEKAIRSTDAVLVCLSSASTNKTGYVQAEIKRALDIADRQPEGKTFIIPVRLEECRVPVRLEPIHYVDYFEENADDRLLRALNHLSGWLNQSGSGVLVPAFKNER